VSVGGGGGELDQFLEFGLSLLVLMFGFGGVCEGGSRGGDGGLGVFQY
jgi:hypothetical protein